MPNFEMQEPQDDSYSSGSLSLPFTVKVEVEAVDETPIEFNEPQSNYEYETVKTEQCDADDTEKSTTDSKVNNSIRRRTGTFLTDDMYKIDKEKVFEELEKISTTTDNIPDKLLEMEVRNTWGQSFYQKHVDSSMNHKMSVCLGKWAAWSLSRSCFDKDTPVAYICYVCDLGWWYLAPFMDHMNSNHEDANLIHFLTTDFESIIVLKVNDNQIRKPIRIYGACPKCGRDADCHEGLQLFYEKHRYRCTYCEDTFVTCSLWSRHMRSCQKYLEHVQTSPVVDNLFMCHLCTAVREKVELIEEHYIYSHSVRSDEPAYVQLKFCKICDELTPCLLTHPCPVKIPSGYCIWCKQRFSTRHLLRLHEAINNSPTHCPLCHERLHSKCLLVAHMAKSHSDNYLLVPKCVLCVEDMTEDMTEDITDCLTCIPSNNKPAPKVYKTRILPNNIPTLKVATSTFNHADTSKITSFKNTPNNIDLDIMDPSDNLDQIVVKEVCGNFVDHADNDSQSDEGEYVNTSSVFYPSSDVKIKTEPIDVETELCTERIKEEIEDNTKQQITEDIEENIKQQIKKEIEDNTMDNDEGILEDEMGVEFETIVKEEVIADHDTINYEDVLAKMLGIKKENSDEDRKENTPGETVKGELLEEMICSNSQSIDESDSDTLVEYTPLTSYFCNKKDMVCCKRCQNIFSPFKYKLHIQFCNKRVYCTSCVKPYENMDLYCEHFAAEHGFERRQCPICKDNDIKGPFVYHIKRHVVRTFVPVSCLTHTADGPKLHIEYKCKRCLEKVGVNSVLAHWEVHYSRTRCDDGNSDDGNSDDVDSNPTNKTKTNENIVEKSREKENIDKVIEILLQKTDRFRRRDYRKEPNIGHTCPICNKVFQRHSTYKIHLIEHVLEYAQQNYDRHSALKCPVCQDNLSETNKFRQHMRDHANLVSYTCTICQKNFSNSSNFAKHTKAHNYNILPCEVCGKKFHQDYQLQKHLEMHKSLGSITCSCCNKLFFDASTHRRHLRLQALKKRPPTFSCKTCKQKFSNTITLKDHEWNVHKIRRFKVDCPKCKQPFRKFSDLKRHLKDIHFVSCNRKGWKKLIGTRATLEKIET